MKVLRRWKFKGCFMIFKGVPRLFQRFFKGVPRLFQRCSKGVPRVFQRCFKEVSRKLSGCFKKVSSCMALIAASRADGGLFLMFAFREGGKQMKSYLDRKTYIAKVYLSARITIEK